jgi:hypothetical protein
VARRRADVLAHAWTSGEVEVFNSWLLFLLAMAGVDAVQFIGKRATAWKPATTDSEVATPPASGQPARASLSAVSASSSAASTAPAATPQTPVTVLGTSGLASGEDGRDESSDAGPVAHAGEG